MTMFSFACEALRTTDQHQENYEFSAEGGKESLDRYFSDWAKVVTNFR